MKKRAILGLSIVGILVLIYIIMIVRIEVKYGKQADYARESKILIGTVEDYHINVNPFFYYENYAELTKSIQINGVNADISFIVKENILVQKQYKILIFTENLTGSVSAQLDEAGNFYRSESLTIPLTEAEQERIDCSMEEIKAIISTGNELWGLHVSIE